MTEISSAHILIIACDGFEESELFDPRQTLLDKGAKVTLASLETDEIQGEKGDKPGRKIKPDLTVAEVEMADYDGLLLPGGTRNPDKLRMDTKTVSLIRGFAESGKPLGAICHAPWLLAEADVIDGKRVTSWPSIRTDIRNAGGNVVDEEAVIDGNIVTSRNPDDIPAFTKAFIGLVEKADARMETA